MTAHPLVLQERANTIPVELAKKAILIIAKMETPTAERVFAALIQTIVDRAPDDLWELSQSIQAAMREEDLTPDLPQGEEAQSILLLDTVIKDLVQGI